ncbi:MAG: hypothetical protein HY247_06455 [archaeon]|nr:MAG: hypothetical protein HY247_06455 [archaeon]
MQEDTEYVNWWQALARDPEYYTRTEQGQKELAEMIRKESERLIEDIGKNVKHTKEVIWLSRFCPKCQFFSEKGTRANCTKWGVRIVKPFQGRAIWNHTPSMSGSNEGELVVEGIDWDSRWREISDRVVEMAVDMVNGGFPYYCYKGK